MLSSKNLSGLCNLKGSLFGAKIEVQIEGHGLKAT